MPVDVNRVLMTGRLGRKPELKHSINGEAYVRMNMANHRGGKETPTQWHQVIVWGKQAELCAQHLSKGAGVLIEGRLDAREYVNNGVKRSSVQVVAERVQFLWKKGRQLEQEVAETELDERAGHDIELPHDTLSEQSDFHS